MKINFFNPGHPYFPLRWLLVMILVSVSVLTYYNFSGERMFSFNEQEQWSSKGPGYHK
jgi:hypothetical protein